MNEQIGLVLWGCKGGYRIFCSNNVVSTSDQEIAQTVKDTRSFFRIHRSGHDFYAIEFTSQYKVFTNYRSSNDSGTGAFIAVTIYVPHNKKVKNMRGMLNEIMDNYFNEYMNPLSNTPLSGKYDDINKFTPTLSRYETIPDRPCYHLPSTQDDTPQIVVYDDLSVVDLYFDSPYRPEFFLCQEVMFISKEIYTHAADYKVEFVDKPKIIDKISEPEEESKLFNNLADLRLTRLIINGLDMTSTGGNCPLSEIDSISFTIERNENYEPFMADCLTAREAVKRGCLRHRKNRKDFEFLPPSSSQWKPKVYYLTLENQGVEVSKLQDRLFLSDGRKQYHLKSMGGHWCFLFSGDEADATYTLQLLPYQDKKEAFSQSSSVKSIVIEEGIRPKAHFSTGLRSSIIEKTVKKADKHPSEYRVMLQCGTYKSSHRIHSDRFSLLVPSQLLSNLSLTFDADDFDAHYDGGDEVRFTPTYMKIYLERDIFDESIYYKLNLRFIVGDTTYENNDRDTKKRWYFRLSYADWLRLKNGEKGRLIYKKDEYEYSTDDDFTRLWIHAMIVTTANNLRTVQVTSILDEAEPLVTDMAQGMYKILPSRCKLSVDESKARIFDEKQGKYVVIKKIYPNSPIILPDDKEKEQKDKKDDIVASKPVRSITFKKCQDFIVVHNNQEFRIDSPERTLKTGVGTIQLCDRRHNLVCYVKHGRNENLVQGKTKKHFTVTWKDDNNCDVEYVKVPFLEKLIAYKKWFAGLGIFILMTCLGVAAFPFIKNMLAGDKNNEYVYNIHLEAEDPNAQITNVSINPHEFCNVNKGDMGDWSITIKVPKDKTDEFKKRWDNPQLTVLSKEDGDTTFAFFDDVVYRQDFDTFFDKEKKEYEKSVDFKIVLPSKTLLKNLRVYVPDKVEDLLEYAKAAKRYPTKGKEFNELAFNAVKRHVTVDFLQGKDWLEKYIALSNENGYSAFKNDEAYEEAKKLKEKCDSAEKAEAKKAQEEKSKGGDSVIQSSDIAKWKEQLGSLDVTENKVNAILGKMKDGKINAPNVKNHCDALMQWFNHKKIDKDLVNYLSKDQRDLYNFYNGKRNNKNLEKVKTFEEIHRVREKYSH